MNLRCIYCQTPFTLSRAEMLGAIVSMNERHQNHYDAHCPRCRRANSISRQQMELHYPHWQEDAAKMKAGAPAAEPAAAALPTEPLAKEKAPAAKKKTAPAKKTTTKAPPKATAEKKTTTKKTATKKK